jgi:hypothetical protein
MEATGHNPSHVSLGHAAQAHATMAMKLLKPMPKRFELIIGMHLTH